MPTPTNCLRQNPVAMPCVVVTLQISSTPKAAKPTARLSSTQSKSAIYLRLALNIQNSIMSLGSRSWRPGFFPGIPGRRPRAAIFSLRLFGLRGQITSAAVVIFVNRLRARRGFPAAPAGVLGQNHRADFGLVARRETDEPGMVVGLLPGLAPRRHLRRPGLAANVEAFDARAAACAALIDHAVHAVYDDLMNRVAHRHVEGVLILVAFLVVTVAFAINSGDRPQQKVRRMQMPAVAQGADVSQKLDRRRSVAALTESGVDHVKIGPFRLMPQLLDPEFELRPERLVRGFFQLLLGLFDRYLEFPELCLTNGRYARAFVRQIDARPLTEMEKVDPLLELIDPHLEAETVEVAVGRMHNGVVNRRLAEM